MDIQNDEPSKLPIILIVVGIILLWGFCWLGTVKLFPGNQWNDRASFGDMFGSVNALFSGLALAGIIYAILLQRRELQLQRRELELTRNELQRSAEAQENSEKALRQQIEKMQEQSELQVRPFVILIKGEKTPEYKLWNAGNGTAINIQVKVAVGSPGEENVYDYSNKTSILVKGQHDLIDDTNPSALEDHIFNIIFQDINKKEYVVCGRLKNGRTELISFDSFE